MLRFFRRHGAFISVIVIAFFVWTTQGVWQIAEAAGKETKAEQAVRLNNEANAKKDPAERLTDALEKMREKSKAGHGKLAKGSGSGAEDDAIDSLLAAVEAEHPAIAKQFAETEMKIAALSPEIKKRHTDFVAMYDKKRATLKKKVAAVDDAWFEFTKKNAYADLNAFLESVKPPSHHQKLDPNKLPNRELEIIKRDPRKSEEDYGDLRSEVEIYKKQNPSLYAEPAWDWFARKIAKAEHGDGVMVASTGLPFGLLNKEAVSFTPVDIMDTVIAQTGGADLPTAADLAPTIEAQSDRQSIIDLAATLNHSPVEIYNWVYNNIEYVPTWGSIQGAEMCMLAKKCNDMDTASLLIALLRASDIPARYVHGTIEVPIDKLMNWTGGFTDVNSAVGFVGAGGTPITAITEGGAINKVEMEHVWVEAYVDYIPSRGAVHRTGDTWAPLDGSYKQYEYTDGIDLQAEVPFDAQAFEDNVNTSVTYDPNTGAMTSIDMNNIATSFDGYFIQMDNYIKTNIPEATYSDVVGYKQIIASSISILEIAGSNLPFVKYSEVPDGLRHKIVFSGVISSHLGNDFSVDYNVPEIAGKRVTLTYSPSNSTAVFNGIPYGEVYNQRAYSVKLKPILRINGQVAAVGGIVGLGQKHNFNMTFKSPYYAPDIMEESVFAGSLYSVVINPNNMSHLETLQTAAKWSSVMGDGDESNVYTDAHMGLFMEMIGQVYFSLLDSFELSVSNGYHLTSLRQTSRLIVSKGLHIIYMYGVPLGIKEGGLSLDVDRDVRSVRSLDGQQKMIKEGNEFRGMNASYMEHYVFEQILGVEATSAVKVLNRAVENGIPIYTVTKDNLDTTLPYIVAPGAVKEDVSSSVNAGHEVVIPGNSVVIGEWSGTGYIVTDMVSGQGSYMISGGMAGSMTTMKSQTFLGINLLAMYCVASFTTIATIMTAGTILMGQAFVAAVGASAPAYAGPLNNALARLTTSALRGHTQLSQVVFSSPKKKFLINAALGAAWGATVEAFLDVKDEILKVLEALNLENSSLYNSLLMQFRDWLRRWETVINGCAEYSSAI